MLGSSVAAIAANEGVDSKTVRRWSKLGKQWRDAVARASLGHESRGESQDDVLRRLERNAGDRRRRKPRASYGESDG